VFLTTGLVIGLLGSEAVTRPATPGAPVPSGAAVDVTVCLQPLAPYDPQMLLAAERGIAQLWTFRVRDLSPQALPDSAYYPPRKRYRAEKLLRHLEQRVQPQIGCDYVLGITAADVSTTKGNAADWGVFGLGEMPGPAAVVSTYRLGGRGASRRQVAVRVVKVVNHELGHNLGLDHCATKGCLMEDARGTIKTVDDETGLLCGACRSRLRGRLPPPLSSVDWDALLKDVR
jgi:archaemetzincin